MAQFYNNAALVGTALLASPGPINLQALSMRLNGTGANYLQCFDAAAAADVTVGTTKPAAAFGSATLNDVVMNFDGNPLHFHKGLVVACTTTASGATGVNTGVNVVLVLG